MNLGKEEKNDKIVNLNDINDIFCRIHNLLNSTNSTNTTKNNSHSLVVNLIRIGTVKSEFIHNPIKGNQPMINIKKLTLNRVSGCIDEESERKNGKNGLKFDHRPHKIIPEEESDPKDRQLCWMCTHEIISTASRIEYDYGFRANALTDENIRANLNIEYYPKFMDYKGNENDSTILSLQDEILNEILRKNQQKLIASNISGDNNLIIFQHRKSNRLTITKYTYERKPCTILDNTCLSEGRSQKIVSTLLDKGNCGGFARILSDISPSNEIHVGDDVWITYYN
jgi:hypothetical protein